MKQTLTALAVAFGIATGIGAAIAMPNSGVPSDFETVFTRDLG